MLDRLLSLFTDPDPQAAAARDAGATQLAAAVLLVEAARSDPQMQPAGRQRVAVLLRRRFDLPPAQVEALITAAESQAAGASDWHRYTSELVARLSPLQRIELIEMLWEVVLADGRLTDLESSLLRRLGGLLYVSDRDRGAARRRALARLGLPDPETQAPPAGA